MEIYFAEPTLDVFLRFTELTGIRLKVLISYCYERGNIEETVNAVSKFAKCILLDSGGFTRRIQLASATPSKLNEKARWYSPLASPSNQRLRGVWAMHTLPGKNGTTSARQ